jgi:lycopene cyclase domain-containing protein
MNWYLLLFVISSIIIQATILAFVGKHIHKKSLIICICVTFFAMLPIEIWATHKGIWSWSDHITFFKVWNIPFEELLLYCTSAVTTVVLFELMFFVLKRTICKSK